jgi:hypothetical protein
MPPLKSDLFIYSESSHHFSRRYVTYAVQELQVSTDWLILVTVLKIGMNRGHACFGGQTERGPVSRHT